MGSIALLIMTANIELLFISREIVNDIKQIPIIKNSLPSNFLFRAKKIQMINNGNVLKCIELNTLVLSTVRPRKFSMDVPKNTLSNT